MTDQVQIIRQEPEPKRPRGANLITSDSGSDGDAEPKNNPFALLLLIGLFAWLGFGAGPRYLLFALALVGMIFLHELGHFATARLTGMKATEFFLGFGPRIWSFKRGETEYGLRAIPAGAFVRIIGMNNLDPVEEADAPRAYMNATYPRRMLVITAGSMMHFLQALIVFTVAVTLVGERDPLGDWEIAELSALANGEAAPATGAGLQPGDVLVSVDGTSYNFNDLATYLREKPGEEVDLVVQRGDSTFAATTTLASQPQSDGSEIGFLGIAPNYSERVVAGPGRAVEIFGDTMLEGVKSIPRFLSPSSFFNLGELLFSGSEDVSINSTEAQERPVSLVGVVRIAGNSDFDWFAPLMIFASINVFVGLINLLPLLPLDGGHAAIATYEAIRSALAQKRHQMDVAKLMPITYAVVALLAFLFLSTTYLDIFRPIG